MFADICFSAASFRVTYTDAAAYVNSAACMDMLNIMNLG